MKSYAARACAITLLLPPVLATPVCLRAQTGAPRDFRPITVATLGSADQPPPLDAESTILPDAPSSLGAASSLPATQSSSSQEATPRPTPPAQATQPFTPEERRQAAELELQREEHQRMAGIVPNFNAVLDGSTVPLSRGQKMRAAFRSAIDPYQFGLAGITSLYGQATDSHSSIDSTGFHHGYEQGLKGFGKRYGASFTDQFNGTIIGNGILPGLLHQDARYFRLGEGPKLHRLLYSASTTIRCKGDNGKWQPNYSNVLGNLISGGISNVYYPAADRGVGLTIEQGILVTAEGTIGALLIEFYPDYQKWRSRRQAAKLAAQSAAQPTAKPAQQPARLPAP